MMFCTIPADPSAGSAGKAIGGKPAYTAVRKRNGDVRYAKGEPRCEKNKYMSKTKSPQNAGFFSAGEGI